MKHKELHMLLWDYLLGQTTAEQTRSIQEHLPECSDCRQALEELHALEASLNSIRDRKPKESFDDRVFEKIAGANTMGIQRTRDIRPNWIVISQRLAAVIAIGIVTGILLIRFSALSYPVNQDTTASTSGISYESMFGEDEMLAFENYLTDQNTDAHENPGE